MNKKNPLAHDLK